jgi:hypothetical protein
MKRDAGENSTMKQTKSQKLMIDDGLPATAVVDQSERKQEWLKNPPSKPAPYRDDRLTEAEIALLFDLKESKERGAASLGCSDRHMISIHQLEKLGFVQQHGFGPTCFYITDAGLKATKKYTRPPTHNVQPEVRVTKQTRFMKASDKAAKEPKASKAAKAPKVKAPKSVKVNPDLSPICIECGINSKNRAAALDFLYSKIGKQQNLAATMKAVYGSEKASESALDTVIRAMQRDLENGKAKDKYEVKRVKDSKGVYNYGFYKK